MPAKGQGGGALALGGGDGPATAQRFATGMALPAAALPGRRGVAGQAWPYLAPVAWLVLAVAARHDGA